MNFEIVQQLPSQVKADTAYLVQRGNLFDLHIVDRSRKVKKLMSFPEPGTDGKYYGIRNNSTEIIPNMIFQELGTENLNDLKTPGFYGKYNSGEVRRSRNYPYDALRGGHLLVLPMTLGSSQLTVFQVYFSAGTTDTGVHTNNARIFMRAFVNNSQWLPWKEFDGGKIHMITTSTLDLTSGNFGDFPLNGSTLITTRGCTITLPNVMCKFSILKADSGHSINFNTPPGVTLTGRTNITWEANTEVNLTCTGTHVHVSISNQVPPTPQTINYNIGTWT